MQSAFLKIRSLTLCLLIGSVASIGSLCAAEDAGSSACLKLPASIHASKRVWCSADDIQFSGRTFGRFALYADAPPDQISTWVRQGEVDPWLQIHSWDIPKIRTVLSTDDQLVMQWSEDCKASGVNFHIISFYRMKTREGEPYWFGLVLDGLYGGASKLERIHGSFDRQWKAGHLKFDRISTRPLFAHQEHRFKGASSVKTLDEAISLVLDQLSDEDKGALRGKAWLDQVQIAREKGILQAIRTDFELDSGCAPLADIRRKSDGAMLPYSWVPDFIFKGVAARIDGRPFVAEDELSNTPLIAPVPSKGFPAPPKN